ncbi:MAG TPA: EamA family transporter [Lachnospiraceae bacterium]|nr:EamA family transporter [Lachnospiraceae bacterium]
MKKWYGSAALLLAAVIWGFAFVAQSVGMEYVGPFTFQAVRSLIGAAALVPVIYIMDRQKKEKPGYAAPGKKEKVYLWKVGIACGIVMCIASCLQQVGILYTTVGKAGFLTSLYLVLVPVLGIFLHNKVPAKIWFCVVICLAGVYLLSMTGSLTPAAGDAMILACAFFFAIHILIIDHFARHVDGVRLSCIQFLISGLLSSVCMFALEKPSLDGLMAAGVTLLYAGVMSCGGAYTLQIIGQQYTEPTTATLLLSMESVFSMVGGIMLLGQTPSLRELCGCALVFAAVILAQLPGKDANQ